MELTSKIHSGNYQSFAPSSCDRAPSRNNPGSGVLVAGLGVAPALSLLQSQGHAGLTRVVGDADRMTGALGGHVATDPVRELAKVVARSVMVTSAATVPPVKLTALAQVDAKTQVRR